MRDLKEDLDGLMERELKILNSEATAKDKEAAFSRLIQLNDIATKASGVDATNKSMTFDRVLQMASLGIQLIGIGLPLIAYGIWFKRGLKFEETGTIGSDMMRNLMSRFKTR